MRIRKNAKNISALLYTNTNVSNINVADECLHQKKINFCELNQSPWDIITFPSSSSSSSFHKFNNYEVDYNVNVAGYWSPNGSVKDFESVDLKTSGLGEKDKANIRKNDSDETLGFKEEDSSDQIQEEMKLCGETDVKGWQCGNVVTKGNTICDFHIELQNYAVLTAKKMSRHGPGPTTGARPHRAKEKPKTNPHEFYYYSGFGPSWGKKRGAAGTGSSDIDGDTSMQGKKGKRFEPEMSEIEPMKNVNEKGKLVTFGKKRMRKPVKERSLKSLM